MVKVTEAIIRSMTAEERRKPEIINGSRRTRIAKGSGTQVSDVNKLVKQFSEMQKMMKRMGGGGGSGSGGGKGKKGGGRGGLGAMFGGPPGGALGGASGDIDLAAALGSRLPPR
jgi:signal recognition particle subunit SRP54